MFDIDSALGIQIEGNNLYMAVVARSLQGYALKNRRIIEGYSDLDRGQLRNSLQQFLNEASFNRENIILGLPRDRVVIRQVELPLEVEENLAQVVQFQVNKIEPNEELKSYSDFLVLARNEKEKNILLQIVMVPRQWLDELLDLFAAVNLYPAAIRVSDFGIHQIFKAHEDGSSAYPVLVVDAEESNLGVVLASGPDQCFAQRVAFDANGNAEEATLRLLDEFVSHLQLPVPEVKKIYLVGSRAEELRHPFQEKFGECELLRRGLRLRNGAAPTQLDSYLYAIGLSLTGLGKSPFSRFNLIPASRRKVGQKASLVPTVILAILMIVLAIGVGTRGYLQQQRLLAAVTQEVERLQPRVEEAMAARQTLQDRALVADELVQIMDSRQSVLAILRELTEKIPEDSYLQSINIQRGKVNLTGFSDSASSLITVLSDSEHLCGIESRYITRDRATGKDKFNFEAKVCSQSDGTDPSTD